MEHETKSVIIGRMKRENKDDDVYPCFVSLFDINNPHKTAEVPQKKFEYEGMHKIIIKGLDFNYLLAGNDIVINDLENIELKDDKPHLYISGKQKK